MVGERGLFAGDAIDGDFVDVWHGAFKCIAEGGLGFKQRQELNSWFFRTSLCGGG